MKFVSSPVRILCGWLRSKDQLTYIYFFFTLLSPFPSPSPSPSSSSSSSPSHTYFADREWWRRSPLLLLLFLIVTSLTVNGDLVMNFDDEWRFSATRLSTWTCFIGSCTTRAPPRHHGPWGNLLPRHGADSCDLCQVQRAEGESVKYLASDFVWWFSSNILATHSGDWIGDFRRHSCLLLLLLLLFVQAGLDTRFKGWSESGCRFYCIHAIVFHHIPSRSNNHNNKM